jgi:hypothetical protein
MNVLKAGTKKYLLLDDVRIARNAERSKKGEAIVLVAEVGADGVITLHRGCTVTVTAAVQLEYSQNRPLMLGRGVTAHAAFVTTGEITLDAPEEPAVAPPAPLSKAAAKAAAAAEAAAATPPASNNDSKE